MPDKSDPMPLSSSVFMAVPLGDERSQIRAVADELYSIISDAVSPHGLLAVRADRIAAPGNITSQIIDQLTHARFIVADISGSNPNVLYEIGVAHALSQPVILLSRNDAPIPFDLAVTRVIFYDSTLRGMARLREELGQAIEYVLSNENAVATGLSPVRIAIDAAWEKSRQHPLPRTADAPMSEQLLAALGDLRERMLSIEGRMIGLEGRRPRGATDTPLPYSRKIFIVHGHDEKLKYELREFLKDLDFEPIILHERPDGGKTIYSKLLGEASDVGYAFILLTPDDQGGMTASNELRPRARQNVVFEHGLFVGRLAPERVCAIVRGPVEIPSDLHGVVYKHLSDGAPLATIAFDLVRELRAAGYFIDLNKLR